jgi:FkbM family methyltransferase
MPNYISKIQNFDVTYTNKKEFNILKEEIFNKEIYKTDLKKKNPLIIDAGAHIGLATLYFKIKYPNSHIIAFEPNPNIFPLLEENILYNNLKNVELHNTALGKKEEIRDFYIDSSGRDWFSTAGFTKDSWKHIQSTTSIKVKTEVLSKYIQKDVDLLKMDIEGAETEVIEELERTNKLECIKKILLEFHPIDKRNYKKIVQILERNNFKVTIKKDPFGDDLVDILGDNISKESA